MWFHSSTQPRSQLNATVGPKARDANNSLSVDAFVMEVPNCHICQPLDSYPFWVLYRCTRRSEIEELFKYFHFDVDEHDIENRTAPMEMPRLKKKWTSQRDWLCNISTSSLRMFFNFYGTEIHPQFHTGEFWLISCRSSVHNPISLITSHKEPSTIIAAY